MAGLNWLFSELKLSPELAELQLQLLQAFASRSGCGSALQLFWQACHFWLPGQASTLCDGWKTGLWRMSGR